MTSLSLPHLCAAAAIVLALANAASVGKERKVQVVLEPKGQGVEADLQVLEFKAYQKQFNRNYEHGSKEYWDRRGLFEQRSEAVRTHNAKPDRIWEAVAGVFADRTEAERSRLLGYKRRIADGPSFGGVGLPTSAARERELLRPVQGNATLPNEFNWLHLRQAKRVPDQQDCGSCWAVASKSVLEAHYEIYVAKEHGAIRDFAAQQIVSCVPNPRACGGTGGCSGSTVELAFDWVLHNGCANEHQVPYRAKDLTLATAKCDQSKSLSVQSMQTPNRSFVSDEHTPEDPAVATPALGGSAFGMYGWQKIEVNKEQPLLMALYHHGPVATSVAATPWFEYKGGIFDGCPQDTVVDHAVTLYGYGEEHVKPQPLSHVMASGNTIGASNDLSLKSNLVKYWTIRNSWSDSWGEDGFIRMKRFGHDGHCGHDDDNYEGTGCEKPSTDGKLPKDPKSVTVCGMCGFLWDSVIPLFGDLNGSEDHQGGLQERSAKVVRREPLF